MSLSRGLVLPVPFTVLVFAASERLASSLAEMLGSRDAQAAHEQHKAEDGADEGENSHPLNPVRFQ